jgi:hypothetical protein
MKKKEVLIEFRRRLKSDMLNSVRSVFYYNTKLKHRKIKQVVFDSLYNSSEQWDLSIKMNVFWIVAPRSPVEIDRCFRGAYCLHHQSHRNRPDDRGTKYL